MNINQLKESKYLKKEDAGTGILVTIDKLIQENVAKEGADPELKWIVYFMEAETSGKGLVLNVVNAQMIAGITKSEETDDWHGHKIVLYHDPNVSFGGKLIGGIRVRAPRNQQPRPIANAVTNTFINTSRPNDQRQAQPIAPIVNRVKDTLAEPVPEDDCPF